MSSTVACKGCGCIDPDGAAAHAIIAALLAADLDRALDAGLLDTAGCAGCNPACSATVLTARNERLTALAARERYRARNARLQRLAERLAARRAPVSAIDARVPAATETGVHATRAAVTAAATTPVGNPALPIAAAAALARAQARATQRRKP